MFVQTRMGGAYVGWGGSVRGAGAWGQSEGVGGSLTAKSKELKFISSIVGTHARVIVKSARPAPILRVSSG